MTNKQNKNDIEQTNTAVTNGKNDATKDAQHTQKCIVLCGGGTGGHVYPNVAILRELKKKFDRIVYVGTNGIEKRVATEQNIEFAEINAVKFKRKLTMETLKLPKKLSASIDEAQRVLDDIKPDAVFSKGGYAALPVVIAARKSHIPVVCHESDCTLGLANKISVMLGAKLLIATNETETLMTNYECVGIPLRKELFDVDKKSAREKLGIAPAKKVILVLGGSLGARKLNNLVEDNKDKLLKKYVIINIVGEKNKTTQTDGMQSNNGTDNGTGNGTDNGTGNGTDNGALTKGENGTKGENAKNNSDTNRTNGTKDAATQNENRLISIGFSNNMPSLYAASDIIVSRSGATAVAEISALKKKAVFIPLPKGASRGDQCDNARLAERHGAVVLVEKFASDENFAEAIEQAANGDKMSPCYKEGSAAVVRAIVRTIDENNKKKEEKLMRKTKWEKFVSKTEKELHVVDLTKDNGNGKDNKRNNDCACNGKGNGDANKDKKNNNLKPKTATTEK